MRYFVTGTDTGIGKTYVLSLILKFFIEKGFLPSVMKPVETGCRNDKGDLIPEDGLQLADIVKMSNQLDKIVPYRFETPVAPYVASLLEKKQIDLKNIKQISDNMKEPFFVEGAGGLMVPILNNFFMIDLPNYLNLEVIFISPLRLGTINQTLLNIEAMEKRKIKIKGIILNDTDGIETPATKTNPTILKELQPYPIIAVVPFKAKALPDFSLLLSNETFFKGL